MDIAKYIGLYLLKNNFCYIHGLGNLELKKKPAAHDGQAIQGPQYDVVLTTVGGSIDDSLANFIATHEQTSISKAANCLRDFSDQTKAALAKGEEVVIPSLGKFVEQNGLTRFVTDPHLSYTPPSIPILRTAKRLEEAPSFKTKLPEDEPGGSGSGISSRMIGIIIVAVVVIAAVVFGIRFMNQPHNDQAAPATVDSTPVVQPVAPEMTVDTSVRDTMNTAPKLDSATAPAPAATATTGGTKVILGTYPTRMAAERRVKTLTSNGNKVELIAKDSTSYYVVLPISFVPADSTRVLDSLRRFFNPKGVSILR